MTETGLLIAQAAVLLLLFGFMAAVVRSSGRQLSRATPPPAPLEDPVDRDTAAHAIVVPSEPASPPTPTPVLPDPDPVAGVPAGWDDDVPDWGAPGAVVPETVAEDAPDAPPMPTDPFPDLGEPVHVESLPPGSTDPGGEHAVLPGEGGDDGTFLNLSANLQPRLIVENGPGMVVGTVFPLGQGLTIGRSRSNELHVDDSFVSHMHARILKRGPFYYVEDLGSTNGTFVNDGRVEGSSQLRVRDTLRMGETILRYEE
ncbi:MAG: FHA domain-containing protein [Thermoleophilia bacterium]|nr:FHA domain-containing protein [Thermoleophilia bacterium]